MAPTQKATEKMINQIEDFYSIVPTIISSIEYKLNGT